MAFFLLVSFIVNGAGLEFLIVYSLSAFLLTADICSLGSPSTTFLDTRFLSRLPLVHKVHRFIHT